MSGCIDYRSLFSKIEKSLRKNIFVTEPEFDRKLEPFLHVDFRNMSDDDIFWVVVYVNFFSGIRAATIERKLAGIKRELCGYRKICDLNKDEQDIVVRKIGFPKKCGYCFKNAKAFKDLIDKHGSFLKYIASFGIETLKPDFSEIALLKKDLRKRFLGLGPRTVNHFLTELGFNVLKPDRVICRIFYRLGLISNVEDIDGAVREGKKFEKATGKPIRYVDIVFVKFGQIGRSEQFGIKNGICLENNPNCDICEAKEFCGYRNEGKRDLEIIPNENVKRNSRSFRMKNMVEYKDFAKIDIRVGKVVEAELIEDAKYTTHKITIDFGDKIGLKRSCARLVNYAVDSLIGRHVIGILNFPPKQIGGNVSEVLTLGVPDQESECVLLSPDKEIPLGGKVY